MWRAVIIPSFNAAGAAFFKTGSKRCSLADPRCALLSSSSFTSSVASSFPKACCEPMVTCGRRIAYTMVFFACASSGNINTSITASTSTCSVGQYCQCDGRTTGSDNAKSPPGEGGDDGDDRGALARLQKLLAHKGHSLRSGDPESSMDAASAAVFRFLESGVPGKVGYGFMMGFSSGYCLKKVSRAAAFLMGCCFMGLQALSSYGYIQVDHQKIKRDVERLLDLDEDGDLDGDDGRLGFERLSRVLTYNMPTGGGFAAGLLLGLRM